MPETVEVGRTRSDRDVSCPRERKPVTVANFSLTFFLQGPVVGVSNGIDPNVNEVVRGRGSFLIGASDTDGDVLGIIESADFVFEGDSDAANVIAGMLNNSSLWTSLSSSLPSGGSTRRASSGMEVAATLG